MKKTGLTKWFAERWVDLSRPIYDEGGTLVGFAPCGRERATSQQATRDYPKCRPLATAMRMSEEERKSAIRRKRRAEIPLTEGRARSPVMVRTNPALEVSERDLEDALQHVRDFDGDGLELADFEIVNLGEVPLDQIEEYDDFSSWVEVEPDDYASLSPAQRVEQLAEFRGDAWARRARRWLTEGIPPIVLVETPSFSAVGDGRGRVNFAFAMGLTHLPAVLLRQRRRNPVSGLAQVFGPLYTRVRAQFPEISICYKLTYDADSGPRSFAYCQQEDDGSFTICIAPKLTQQARHRIEGLFAHEIGHAILMHLGDFEHTERDADNAAEQAFGFRIFYDEDDVQSTRYGTRPRPPYLDDEDGFTCVS
jgi:hypothetical protein